MFLPLSVIVDWNTFIGLNFACYWIVLWLIILRVLYRLGLNCSILKDSTFLCISNQSKSVQNQSQSTCKYHNFCCYMIKILIPRYLYQFCWHSSAISVNKTLVCCFVVTACWRYCQSFAQRRKQAFLFIEIIFSKNNIRRAVRRRWNTNVSQSSTGAQLISGILNHK